MDVIEWLEMASTRVVPGAEHTTPTSAPVSAPSWSEPGTSLLDPRRLSCWFRDVQSSVDESSTFGEACTENVSKWTAELSH